MNKHCRIDVAQGVMTIWNCNAGQRNALTPEYYAGINAGLERATNDAAIHAVVLAGEGGFFCSGGNLNALKLRRELSMPDRRAKVDELHAIILGIRACPKPVIAAVEGGAAGAGLSLAMACDLIVAGESAKFTLAYVKAGLTPDGGASYALMQAMPRATVARMALLGTPVAAARMYALGAISDLVADDAVLGHARDLALKLGAGPEQAIANIKSLLNAAETSDLESHLIAERDAVCDALGGDEGAEGIAAFLDKRKPVFR
ncbi:oxepin-CoA hydrolase, alternative type [uncultured Shimia sp.]|uniref:oxepin-CoA hydrolase, alternative type n=1 Tax=uncultured Shimia sp. TaxID=573152 RepID=UPI002628E202|nr:enoyl-CoA hydratase family protein [uncultured Shimia sp.]